MLNSYYLFEVRRTIHNLMPFCLEGFGVVKHRQGIYLLLSQQCSSAAWDLGGSRQTFSKLLICFSTNPLPSTKLSVFTK